MAAARGQFDVGHRGLAASVLIPTYNRLDALRLCLAALERQTVTDFEVILIDDGSTDGTAEWVAGYAATTSLRFRHAAQKNSGPARARNVAASLAESPLCIIIGDDILCSAGFVEAHVRHHQRHPEMNLAGLGLTVWNETEQTVTPFMRWMDESGTQFAYHDLLAGQVPDWRHFYTSNLSLKTELLLRHPFSEEFPSASMEDMELGYRLEQKEGMRVAFLPEALAEHVHPIDFRRACKRAFGTGRSLQVFDRLWPAREVTRHGWAHRALRKFMVTNPWLVGPLTALTAKVTERRCPNPLIGPTLAYHVALGRLSEL